MATKHIINCYLNIAALGKLWPLEPLFIWWKWRLAGARSTWELLIPNWYFLLDIIIRNSKSKMDYVLSMWHLIWKCLLMRVKRESEKAGLKLNIQKTMTMASGPFISWQIDGGKVETVTNFIFLSSKITKDGDCRHEIKKSLLLERKAMINLDSIFKSRDMLCWQRSI